MKKFILLNPELIEHAKKLIDEHIEYNEVWGYVLDHGYNWGLWIIEDFLADIKNKPDLSNYFTGNQQDFYYSDNKNAIYENVIQEIRDQMEELKND